MSKGKLNLIASKNLQCSKMFIFSVFKTFNDLVVKALDTQSIDPRFKTTGWLQG